MLLVPPAHQPTTRFGAPRAPRPPLQPISPPAAKLAPSVRDRESAPSRGPRHSIRYLGISRSLIPLGTRGLPASCSRSHHAHRSSRARLHRCSVRRHICPVAYNSYPPRLASPRHSLPAPTSPHAPAQRTNIVLRTVPSIRTRQPYLSTHTLSYNPTYRQQSICPPSPSPSHQHTQVHPNHNEQPSPKTQANP
ncbi:uncharacterized protein K452DRAFT_289676 [Aplosporella prunicola CBS 121167]|uniref:Uncharacterized protein n=1 Tax=Aplosporella prunicola CBS 121167 TaxID=1176127 RepID=A0A6A6BAZ9_9PEZI|nr:uncharacterized protein K452DRAFT_289676 [Aplosporella prunicola CBS 121167]KAF2139681.1 hypothetical protein K452DRAFT_289676 [Aplosporella prunicola CBS 121167]